MRKTKIICTLGPATKDDQCIKSVDKIKEVIDVKEKKINKLRHH